MDNTPSVTLRPGTKTDGFTVNAVTPLPNLRANAYSITHDKTGARLLHVHSGDSENLFSITFPTPPSDDTGVPHILEHAVLGGSRKFPVKEPFFEMIKMSMATFINAMTGDVYTVYPVATTVKRDFFNLAEVYADAVFQPQLTEETFKREGHHFTLAKNDDPTSDLRVKGIVYNEMKGAYSSPEGYIYRKASRSLLPDTPMGRDSGGDPEAIPSLTYEGFKKFHETLYHPSNAYIFLYGDIPTSEHLAFLKDKLDAFEKRPVPPPLPRQPRWREPRTQTLPYPIGATEPTAAKTYITVGWIAGNALNPAESSLFAVLDRALLGNEAAPLRKAIIDSKLGADVFFAGAGRGGHEGTFSVGLKGTEPDRAEAFLKLVLDTLESIAAQGLKKELIDAAFQQLAYSTLEIQTLFPLRLMGQATSGWLHGGDPLTLLRPDQLLANARKTYEADPGVFNRLIRERLVRNPHRLLSIFTPDRDVQAKRDAAFAEQMKSQRSHFSGDELREIGKAAAALEAKQGVPNPPEALAKLPQLKVSDLPRKPRHIPTSIEKLPHGLELLRNDVFANGVNYLHLDCDIAELPAELFAFIPRWDEAFSQLGAAGQPFTKIAERRAAYTGGVGAGPSLYSHATDATRHMRRLRFSLKTLDGQIEPALALLRDLLFEVDPRDKDRLRDVVEQTRAWRRTSFINEGSGAALRHASRRLNSEFWLANEMHGLPQLAQIESLGDGFDREADGLIAKIETLRDFFLKRGPGRWTASFTGSDSAYNVVRRTLGEWMSAMKDAPPPPRSPVAVSDFREAFRGREGLAGPVQVSYVTLVMPAPHSSFADGPLLDLASRFMSLDYFLSEIRFKGNAYGGGCYYSGNDSAFGMYSYRDPRLLETLGVFRGLKDYVRNTSWSQAEIDRAIIGSCKYAEKPIRPGEATDSALVRHLRGDTNELREALFSQLLTATPANVKRVLLEQLEANESNAAVCVLSSREKLEEANRSLGPDAMAIEEILKNVKK